MLYEPLPSPLNATEFRPTRRDLRSHATMALTCEVGVACTTARSVSARTKRTRAELKRWSTAVMLGRGLSLAIIAAVAAGFGGADTQAQTWPEKPVRIVIPYAAGGNSDGIARITAQRL